jgi:hypothetical protein
MTCTTNPNSKGCLIMPEISYREMPRLHIFPINEEGEQTFRLGLPLPCCHMELYIEGAPTLSVSEMQTIVNAYRELHSIVKALPTFSGCNLKKAA